MRNYLSGLFCVLLVSCSASPVIVHYQAPEDATGDWYPLPSDAPSSVVTTDIEVAPAGIQIAIAEQQDTAGQLSLTRQTDSIGNSTLVINRSAALSWVLIESALAEQGYDVTDKDREGYRFELKPERKNGSLMAALFAKPPELLYVILIPQGNNTMVVVEGEGDELPDADSAEQILDDLQESLA